MSYIGNARTLLIVGSNVRDDLEPDPLTQKQSFVLSQEVPGGYEGNVTVVRRRYVESAIVKNTSEISIQIINSDTSKLVVSNDQDLAAALSVAIPPFTEKDASNIKISGSTISSNNGTFKIIDTTYNGTTTEIILDEVLVAESGPGRSLTIHWGRTNDWEVLEPERDYLIGGDSETTRNRILTFTGNYIPSENDIIYVIHRGEGTYNLVPSDKSVGYNQLEDNLKDFACDRFIASGDISTEYQLSRTIPTEKCILVTVNGVVLEGKHINGPIPKTVDEQPIEYYWTLSATNNSIKFVNSSLLPQADDVIRVLHLGFTSGLRRYAFSPGQVDALPPGSVSPKELQNNSVIKSKIAPNAVDSTKLLIEKDGALRAVKQDGVTETNLIKLNTLDNTEINGLTITSTSVIGSGKSLGTPSTKFTDLNLSGDITIDGNITIAPTKTIDGVDLSALKAAFDALSLRVASLIPVGTIMVWTKATPHESNWLVCDGSAVSRTTYADLFAAIGTTFGAGNGTTTFNLPDLRRRYPIGFLNSVDTIGNSENRTENDRTINHSHGAGSHTHNISHTHTLPSHYHLITNSINSETTTLKSLNITSSGGHQTTVVMSPTGNTFSVKTGPTTATVSNPWVNGVNEGAHFHNVVGATLGGAIANSIHTVTVDSITANNQSGTQATLAHNHPNSTSGGGGSHTHNLLDIKTFAPGDITSSGGGYNIFYRPSTSDPTLTDSVNTVADHQHTTYTPTSEANLTHQHKINFKTGCAAYHTALSGGSGNEGAHIHTVTFPRLELRDNVFEPTETFPNRGKHIHENSNFAGGIGNFAGVSGDSTMTSGSSSKTDTDASTGTTEAYTPPHLMLNFIIKASNA